MTEVGKVQEYTLEFQIIMADRGWNDEALIGQYRLNLHYRIKDTISAQDTQPDTLSAWIKQAHQMD